MEILIFLWALEKLSNSLYCSFNKHFLQPCWYYLKFRIRGIQNDFTINNYVTEVIYMIFWYARYFEYCIYFLKLCFYFLNLRKESLSLIKQISTSTIIFTYTCLDVSPGEGLEIRECSRIGSFLEPSYACLGEPWVQIWPRICKERGHEGWRAFCHHCRRPRGCSSHRYSACTHWEPSSQHRASRASDMPGTSTLSSHPHPHVTAQVSFSMLPAYTAGEEGNRVSVR